MQAAKTLQTLIVQRAMPVVGHIERVNTKRRIVVIFRIRVWGFIMLPNLYLKKRMH